MPDGVDFFFFSHMYLQPTHRKSAFAALGELRKGLRDALVLELQPGEAFCQESSIVLLRGKLMATGRADTVPLQQLPGQLLALLTCCAV